MKQKGFDNCYLIQHRSVALGIPRRAMGGSGDGSENIVVVVVVVDADADADADTDVGVVVEFDSCYLVEYCDV